MAPLSFRRLLLLFSSLVMLFVLGTACGKSQEGPVSEKKTLREGSPMISGTAVLMRKQYSRFGVDKAEGHYLCLYVFEGNNKGTCKSGFMNDAATTEWIFADAVKRNGPIQGYTSMSNQCGSVLLKLNGHWTTIECADGSPLSQFEGSFIIEKGTGQFANIEGTGTFTGKMTTAFVQVVEWEGEYSIRK
jgi:hypothetical protein